MNLPRLRLWASTVALALAACASAPAFLRLPADPAPPAFEVAETPQRWMDRAVVWGGMIMQVRNYEHHSEIEILAYPLDDRQRPQLEQADQGRFIALLPGYVEAQDFPQGRFLSLIGRITGERRGVIRASVYVWPEVDVDALHLWPRNFRSGPKFSVGIGIGIR